MALAYLHSQCGYLDMVLDMRLKVYGYMRAFLHYPSLYTLSPLMPLGSGLLESHIKVHAYLDEGPMCRMGLVPHRDVS